MMRGIRSVPALFGVVLAASAPGPLAFDQRAATVRLERPSEELDFAVGENKGGQGG